MAVDVINLPVTVIDRATGHLAGIQASLTGMARTSSKDVRGLNEVIGFFSSNIRTAALPALAAFGIAGGSLAGIVGGLTVAMKGFARDSVALKFFSQDTRLSIAEIEKFRVVADGIDFKEPDQALRTFHNNMLNLRGSVRGLTPEAQSLREALIAAGREDIYNKLFDLSKLKDNNEALRQTKKYLNEIGDSDWGGVLSKIIFGTEQVHRMAREEAHLMSLLPPIVHKNIEAAERLDDQFKVMDSHFANIKTLVSNNLYEPFTAFAGDFNKFLAENEGEIGTSITTFLGSVAKSLRDIRDAYGVVKPYLDMFNRQPGKVENPLIDIPKLWDEVFPSREHPEAGRNRVRNPESRDLPFGGAWSAAPGSPAKRAIDEPKTKDEQKSWWRTLLRLSAGDGSAMPINASLTSGGGGIGGGGLSGMRGLPGGYAVPGGGSHAGGAGGGMGALPDMGPNTATPENAASMDPMARSGQAVGAPSGLTTITTPSGRKMQVATEFAPNFQKFVNDYEGAGGVIGPNTGGAAGRGNASYHPLGRAIDVNQTGYGIRGGGKSLPQSVEDRLAFEAGLYPGSRFKSRSDIGHFEVRNRALALEHQKKWREGQSTAGAPEQPPGPEKPHPFLGAQRFGEADSGGPAHPFLAGVSGLGLRDSFLRGHSSENVEDRRGQVEPQMAEGQDLDANHLAYLQKTYSDAAVVPSFGQDWESSIAESLRRTKEQFPPTPNDELKGAAGITDPSRISRSLGADTAKQKDWADQAKEAGGTPQKLSGFLSKAGLTWLGRLDSKINPKGWEAFQKHAPLSDNVEDRRSDSAEDQRKRFGGSLRLDNQSAEGMREYLERGEAIKPSFGQDWGKDIDASVARFKEDEEDFSHRINKSLGADTGAVPIEGSGKMGVNVVAPKGTTVKASGDGLFKEVQTTRRTSQPAEAEE